MNSTEYALQMDCLLSKASWHSHTQVEAVYHGSDVTEEIKEKKVWYIHNANSDII